MKKYNLYLEIDKEFKYNDTIMKATDLLDVLRNDLKLGIESEEVLILICLNTKNKIIGVFEVSRGSLNYSATSPREIFKRAITCNASSIILAHNHPSGDANPSENDNNVTFKIKEISKIFDIPLLDHIIVTQNNFYSYNDARAI